jgi:hypothetical protein
VKSKSLFTEEIDKNMEGIKDNLIKNSDFWFDEKQEVFEFERRINEKTEKINSQRGKKYEIDNSKLK